MQIWITCSNVLRQANPTSALERGMSRCRLSVPARASVHQSPGFSNFAIGKGPLELGPQKNRIAILAVHTS